MTTFYVFGESSNDTSALIELIYARASAEGKMTKAIMLRTPLIQQKNATSQTRKTNAQKVEAAVKARLMIKKEQPVVVVAHEDCDQVEPAHQAVALKIETGLAAISVPVVAAAPAWEIEAWWYLWPDAVAAVCTMWKRLGRGGSNVGLIHDAKTTIRRELRPTGKSKVRDYEVSDSPFIAKKVRLLGLIDKQSAASESFKIFDDKIKNNL